MLTDGGSTNLIITESRPSDVLAALHESADAEREYLFAARDPEPRDLILVAWQGDTAVGYIATTDNQQDGMLIWEHLVVPAHRSKGLGRRLLREAVRRTVPGAVVQVDPLGELDAQRLADYYGQYGFTYETADGRLWSTAAGVMRAVGPESSGLEDKTPIQHLLDRKAPGVVTIAPDQPVRAALHTLNERRIGAVVISSDGSRVEGIISERDILLGIDDDSDGFLDRPVNEVTTPDVLTCTADDSIMSAMNSMTTLRIRHLPVTQTGTLAGIISIGDIVSYRLDAMEAQLAPAPEAGAATGKGDR